MVKKHGRRADLLLIQFRPKSIIGKDEFAAKSGATLERFSIALFSLLKLLI